MAAIFCLFSLTLCKLANQVPDMLSNHEANNVDNHQNYESIQPLAAIVSVPRTYLSPCPESFRYTFNGNEWIGLIAVPNNKRFRKRLNIQIILSVRVIINTVSSNTSLIIHHNIFNIN